VLYYAHIFDKAAWLYETRTFPLTEISFSGIGFLGGVIYRWHEPETWKEHLFIPLVTAAILLVPFVKPLINPLDLGALRDRCDGVVCLQSSFSTCGPASAATILRGFGQNVTEKDLALESFTSRGGTEAWYLARALRKRGNITKFVFSDSALPYPAVAGVRLQGDAGHFIAILDEDNATFTVVDPLSGVTSLSAEDLRKKYRFTGFFMTITPPRP